MKIFKYNQFIDEKIKIMPISNDELDKILDYEPDKLYKFKNLTISELKCFDILETRSYKYIFITADCRKTIDDLKKFRFYNNTAFRVNRSDMEICVLGLDSFDKNLKCTISHSFDIINVYRGLNPKKCLNMSFYAIYNKMEKMFKNNKIIECEK